MPLKPFAWLALAATLTACSEQHPEAHACADCGEPASEVAAACCETEVDAPGPDSAEELAALSPEGEDGSVRTVSLSDLMGGGAEPPPTVEDGTGLPNYGALPDFSLVSDAGVDFDRSALLGDVWVVDFIFTRCAGPCPQMSKTYSELVDEDIAAKLLSVTVDPGFDSPQVLSQYRANWEVEAERWTLLTGSREGVKSLAEDGFKLPVNTSDKETVEGMGPLFHSGKFALVDVEGRVRGYYNYTDALEMKKLKQDAAALAATAN